MHDQRQSSPEFRITKEPQSEYINFPQLPERELEHEVGLLPGAVTKSNARRRPSFGDWLMYRICTTLNPEYAAVVLELYAGGPRKKKKGFFARITELFRSGPEF